ncbi:MAG: hydroxymethylpyrimidine/phosphomethylpyrimidine kinase [Bacteroidetes bacterium]|nr:hydroxymethylpyrimidine/phosphomethylpyrimidine kinase [Bacteroidota bacterium]
MQTERPYVLTIAGLDPSSGAGLTADVKTFEQLKVYGLAVCTGLTLQTENEFVSVSWRKIEEVKQEMNLLLNKYPVKAVKFGIVPSFEFLRILLECIKEHDRKIQVVVDPVWRSSTGFEFNQDNFTNDVLKNISLITPNLPELEFLSGAKSNEQYLNEIREFTNILLKGGHKISGTGLDVLYTKTTTVEFISEQKNISAKHGSGCVLSAAITAELARGENLENACALGKKYIENFLSTNKSLLGFHAA